MCSLFCRLLAFNGYEYIISICCCHSEVTYICFLTLIDDFSYENVTQHGYIENVAFFPLSQTVRNDFITSLCL